MVILKINCDRATDKNNPIILDHLSSQFLKYTVCERSFVEIIYNSVMEQ